MLVVHVELGGLAEALSAAMSTAPQVASRAPGTEAGADRHRPAEGAPRPNTAEPEQAVTEMPTREGGGLIPAFPAAERAVRALSEAVKYAQWRREAVDPGRVPEFEDIDEKGAAALIGRLLARAGRASPSASTTPATCSASTASTSTARSPHPPRMPPPKPPAPSATRSPSRPPPRTCATAPTWAASASISRTRTNCGGRTPSWGAVRAPEELRPVVQRMAPRGVDTVVRAVIDPAAGAVLSFGLAGAASQLLGDTAHRLIPVTDREAASLVRSIRTAPLLFGWRGSTPVDTPALEELMLRVSRLVDDHPEVVAVALEPVVVAAHGLSVLGASVRLAPPPARDDLGPRTLPVY